MVVSRDGCCNTVMFEVDTWNPENLWQSAIKSMIKLLFRRATQRKGTANSKAHNHPQSAYGKWNYRWNAFAGFLWTLALYPPVIKGGKNPPFIDYLVGHVPTPLNNMSLSVGMITFPIWWENHKIHVPNHQHPPTSYVRMYFFNLHYPPSGIFHYAMFAYWRAPCQFSPARTDTRQKMATVIKSPGFDRFSYWGWLTDWGIPETTGIRVAPQFFSTLGTGGWLFSDQKCWTMRKNAIVCSKVYTFAIAVMPHALLQSSIHVLCAKRGQEKVVKP